jgi:hypothetical protein
MTNLPPTNAQLLLADIVDAIAVILSIAFLIAWFWVLFD